MTEVAFHFNVPDQVDYLCRLLRKVSQARMRALVCLPKLWVESLDTALWTFAQEEFVAHARWDDPETVRARSPVLLSDRPAEWPEAQVLINALSDMPLAFQRYQKVIEIVGVDAQERVAARLRWKAYTQMGYELVQHDGARFAHGARA